MCWSVQLGGHLYHSSLQVCNTSLVLDKRLHHGILFFLLLLAATFRALSIANSADLLSFMSRQMGVRYFFGPRGITWGGTQWRSGSRTCGGTHGESEYGYGYSEMNALVSEWVWWRGTRECWRNVVFYPFRESILLPSFILWSCASDIDVAIIDFLSMKCEKHPCNYGQQVWIMDLFLSTRKIRTESESRLCQDNLQ